jgi:hypothetical protein
MFFSPNLPIADSINEQYNLENKNFKNEKLKG